MTSFGTTWQVETQHNTWKRDWNKKNVLARTRWGELGTFWNCIFYKYMSVCDLYTYIMEKDRDYWLLITCYRLLITDYWYGTHGKLIQRARERANSDRSCTLISLKEIYREIYRENERAYHRWAWSPHRWMSQFCVLAIPANRRYYGYRFCETNADYPHQPM